MRRIALLISLLVLAACAEEPRLRQNLVVVIPDADGKVGSVRVAQGGSSQLLDTAFAAAQIGRTGLLEPVAITELEARSIFKPALDAQPRLPTRFRLYFQTNSDQLTADSAKEFEQVFADVTLRGPSFDMEVIGHTDTTGSAPVNQRLSEQRARAIAALLATRGIAVDRVLATGRGENDLLITTPDEIAEPRNRRVEVMVR
jgi:outer membrane protein OmpA-like peptidoglycan-associated protein